MAVPAWKRRVVTAGAMMLLKDLVERVTTCDACQRALERADGTIDVTFKDKAAHYPCPHCGAANTRLIRRRVE